MLKRAGSSFVLSLLIVGLAAVALHRPEPRKRPRPVSVSRATPTPAARKPPELVPEGPPPAAPAVVSATAMATVTPTAFVERAPSRPGPAPPPPEPARSTRRTSYTSVRPGETLADIARRVYGDPTAVDRLRAANRDQLPGADAVPVAGTVLRTP